MAGLVPAIPTRMQSARPRTAPLASTFDVGRDMKRPSCGVASRVREGRNRHESAIAVLAVKTKPLRGRSLCSRVLTASHGDGLWLTMVFVERSGARHRHRSTKTMVAKTPRRRGAVIPKGSKHSGEAAKPLDCGSAGWPRLTLRRLGPAFVWRLIHRPPNFPPRASAPAAPQGLSTRHLNLKLMGSPATQWPSHQPERDRTDR
jgi:hypothetical protein